MTTGEDKQPESNFDALAEAKKMFALYEAGAQDAGVSVEQYGGKFNDYQFAKAIIALKRELDEAKHLQETAEQRYEKFYEGYAPPSSVSSSLACTEGELSALRKDRESLNAMATLLATARRDAALGNDLVAILQQHCGQRGDNEGAVETLNRIIRERDYTRSVVARVERGEAVNLARQIKDRDACVAVKPVISEKGIDMLADAVLRMDAALLAPAATAMPDSGRAAALLAEQKKAQHYDVDEWVDLVNELERELDALNAERCDAITWSMFKARAEKAESELADANAVAEYYVREPGITPRRAMERQAAEIERLRSGAPSATTHNQIQDGEVSAPTSAGKTSEIKPDGNADAGRSGAVGEEGGEHPGSARSDAVFAGGAECGPRPAGGAADQEERLTQTRGEGPAAALSPTSARPDSQPSTQWKFWREARVMELEPYYCYWVSHLTSEGLHDKGDIATVLAILHQQRDDMQDDALRLHREKMALIDKSLASSATEKQEPAIAADISADRQWIAGATFGWNCGVADDPHRYNDAIARRYKQIGEAKEQPSAKPRGESHGS